MFAHLLLFSYSFSLSSSSLALLLLLLFTSVLIAVFRSSESAFAFVFTAFLLRNYFGIYLNPSTPRPRSSHEDINVGKEVRRHVPPKKEKRSELRHPICLAFAFNICFRKGESIQTQKGIQKLLRISTLSLHTITNRQP